MASRRRRLRLALAACAGVAVAVASGFAAASDHQLIVADSGDITVGARAPISLTISPAPDHRISQNGPLVVELEVEGESDAIRLPRTRYQRKHAADPRAAAPRFDLIVEGHRVGSAAVAVSLRFWVCAKNTCRPVRARRVVTVTVTAPTPDAGPSDATSQDIGESPPGRPVR